MLPPDVNVTRMIDPPRRASVSVSVVIPAYRGAAHVGATIDSVLAQTYRDFELVIVDDNSPDETYAIAASYRDSRVRCVRNPRNLGPEGNWNRCLEEAAGTYVKLLPQDDLLAPSCLQRQVDVLEQDTREQIAIVFSARTIVDGRGRRVLERRPFGSAAQRLTGQQLFHRCLYRGTNVIGEPGGVLFRRALAHTVGRFDATFPYVVDLDYWLRLLAHGDGFYLPEPLAAFRVSPGAWSVAIGASQPSEFAGLMAANAREKRWRANAVDLAAARAIAHANNLVRLTLYRFLFRGEPT